MNPNPPIPPPLPQQLPPSDQRGLIIDRRVVPGTEQMTPSEIAGEVLAGGKFVHFLYCFSVVIMTFRRSSGIVFLRRNEDGGASAIGCSLLTLFAGWWGFPWGPIYSIGSLITNARGGKDLTREVLGLLLPSAAADQVMLQRRKSSAGPALWMLRAGLLGVPVALIAATVAIGARSAREEAADARIPGHAEFKAANATLGPGQQNSGSGNTNAAREFASAFSGMMGEQHAVFFKSASGQAISTDAGFNTWCELRDDRCIVLLRAPDLRKYDAEATRSLCQLAWAAAMSLCHQRQVVGKSPFTLAVGVRGLVSYEQVMTAQIGAVGEGSRPTELLSDRAGRERLGDLFARALP